MNDSIDNPDGRIAFRPLSKKKKQQCICGFAFGDREQPIICGYHYEETLDRIAALEKKLESTYNSNESLAQTAQVLIDKVAKLQKLGDALAATGGQHGFDDALDAWNKMCNE